MSGATPAAGQTPLAGLAGRYLEYLRHEKRCSAHTLAATQRDLSGFIGYCSAADIVEPAQIDAHLLRSWIGARRRAGSEAASLHRYLSSLRSWFRYLLREQLIVANPAVAVRAPRRVRKLPASIDADTLGSALDSDDGDNPLAIRDRAIIELFYSAGLRLAELQQLDLSAIAGQSAFTVRGKGNKERIAMLGGKARIALDRWLRLRPSLAAAGEPALFVSARGRRLSRSAVAHSLRRWAQRTALGVHLHPHRLRHAFATHMLENSQDLRAVQELLGHSHLSTTQIYTHLDWKHLARVYDDAHPRARRRRPA